MSDQHAQDRMWRHSQHQTNQDRKPRIPLHLNISEAPDVESKAVLKRGIEGKQQQQTREKLCQQEWDEKRKPKPAVQHQRTADDWEEIEED